MSRESEAIVKIGISLFLLSSMLAILTPNPLEHFPIRSRLVYPQLHFPYLMLRSSILLAHTTRYPDRVE